MNQNTPHLLPGERLDRVNDDLLLISKTDGLTFGTDAFLLASFVRPHPRGRAAELGTGTGIISLLLAERERFAHVHALELQPDFAELAERNASLNGLGHRMTVHLCDVRHARPELLGGEVDTVLANPPYMRTDSGKRNETDHKYIARHEVAGTVADFCAAAGRLLKHGGRFYCVWRPDRLSELMAALAEHRLEPKTMVFVHADETAEPSSVLVGCIKGGARGGLRVLPPLLLHPADTSGGARPLTPRAERIYRDMRFEDEADRIGRSK